MKDIWVVCKKELKELLSSYGDQRSSLLRVALLCGVFGLVLPLAQKEIWITTPLPALFYLAIPLTIVSGVVIDSFAGERERGTLETLLATRLPNRAILLGKVSAIVIYAWSIVFISFFLSLIGLNLIKATPGPFFYSTFVLLVGLVGSFLVAFQIAGVGVFVSLKAKSTRAAQQTLSMSMLVLFLAIGFGLPALAGALPQETVMGLLEIPTTINLWSVAFVVLLILAALDAAILSLAIRQFKRARLILI
jgi:ABC-2 type transport system permease protein